MNNNLDKIKQLVIIGGGTSLREGISKGLWNKLRNHFVIGTNYSFLYYPNPTIQTFVDNKFYTDQQEGLSKLPLIIGRKHNIKKPLPNTILLPASSSKYHRDLKGGIYKASLCGIFSLSLGIYLLDQIGREGEKRLFLLGFDFGGQGKDSKGRALTHFYQGEIIHRGIAKCNYYEMTGRGERDFGVFRNEKIIKIFNVGLKSNIPCFPKISYDEFFELLDKKQYNQEELRQYIKEKLKGLK